VRNPNQVLFIVIPKLSNSNFVSLPFCVSISHYYLLKENPKAMILLKLHH